MAYENDTWWGNFYNTMTGQVNPNDLTYIQWDDQAFDPSWNVQAQGYNPSMLGQAQGYTGQGYDATTGQAVTSDWQLDNQFGDILSQAVGASQQFMDPQSDWARGQQAILAETTGQQAGQTQAQQNAMLAQRGMGSGGLRNILGSQAQATAGQAARQGATDIATQGAGLGLQALGQAGQMSTAGNQMTQQAAFNNMAAQNQFGLANMAAQNQAAQFGAAAQNQANQWSAGQQNQFGLANQAAANQAAMFGADAANTANQFNATNVMNWDAWNASQGFAADQFNASQGNTVLMGNTANESDFWSDAISFGAQVGKFFFSCIPEGTKIDTPDGSKNIEDLNAGDEIVGYDGKSTTLQQKHEYKENPDLNRFLEITFDDDSKVNLCDMHRIDSKRSKDYDVGDKINNKTIKNIKWYGGVETSYDLLTTDRGYRISGMPVNSMIDEMMYTAYKLKEVA
jgi:hypothetical protein